MGLRELGEGISYALFSLAAAAFVASAVLAIWARRD